MIDKKVMQLLNNKVSEVFMEMQEELKIQDGDVAPLDMFELQNCMDKLTNKIVDILKYQMD